MDEPIAQIQSHINCISFPKTLDELHWIAINDYMLSIEVLVYAEEDEVCTWTVPRWAKPDDIIFFYHAKTSKNHISRLRKELNQSNDYSEQEKQSMFDILERGNKYYDLYGGKIFALGCMSDYPYYYSDEDDGHIHHHSNTVGDIDCICILESPVDIAEVKSFITIAPQASITPVFGEAYIKLRDMIADRDNECPEYFFESESVETNTINISSKNWIQKNFENKRKYQFENQFRVFYVDYLLQILSDRKIVYRECPCVKNNSKPSYVDNVIVLNKYYLPVEIKLNIDAEKNIIRQINKYCHLDKLFLTSDLLADNNLVINNRVLVIDTRDVFIYDCDSNLVSHLTSLDNIKSNTDIKMLREEILKHIIL